MVVDKMKEVEVLAKHWKGLEKVPQSGEDAPIDTLESKAKEVNWMMELVGFQECSLL